MSKQKSKTSITETTQAWIAKHATEALDLKALTSALGAVEKSEVEAQALAVQLGDVLETRKQAIKALKAALKATKAARKTAVAPVAPPATPKKAPAPKAPKAPKAGQLATSS